MTTYFLAFKENFKTCSVPPPFYLKGKDFRLTVDTKDDLKLMRRIYEEFYRENPESLTAMCFLADTLWDLGEKERARELFLPSISILSRRIGEKPRNLWRKKWKIYLRTNRSWLPEALAP